MNTAAVSTATPPESNIFTIGTPEPTGLRAFVSQATKKNSFYLKIGTVAAGFVILSLLVATGVMYYKDRQARATVPAVPPIDAIISPLQKAKTEALAASTETLVTAPQAAASEPLLAPNAQQVAGAGVVPVAGLVVAAGAASSAGAGRGSVDLQLAAHTAAIDDISKRVDGMQTQFDGITKVIADLQKQVNAQGIRLRAVTADKREEVTDMKVTQISTSSVDVMVGLKKYTVASGGKLPGGATYIGFDVAKSMMRTDRGDFQIQ